MDPLEKMLTSLRRQTFHVVPDAPDDEAATPVSRPSDIARVERLIERYGWQHLRVKR